MIRPKINNNSLNENAYTTIPSDNIRVVSPYRVELQVKSTQKRPTINLRETVLRLRKEQDEQQERERIAARLEADRRLRERDDEDRRKRNEEYYQKKEQEKQAKWEEEKAQREKYAQEEAKKKDELYEHEYRAWLEDVQKNPDNYSESTQETVKRAMHSYKHPKDYLARLDRGLARALFGLKNAAGKTALSSIDTNGTSIFGQLSLTEYKQEALKYHDYSLQLLLSINDLDQQRKNLTLKYNVDSEYAAMKPNDPAVLMFNNEYQELTGQINGLKALLNDPNIKLFDDAYKLLYTVDKEGFWASVGRKYRDAISAQTYDQYKDYVALRDRQRDIAEYSNILTEEDNKNRNGYKGADFLYSKVPMGAGYRAPQTKRNYTPEEILQLDVRKTAERSKELEEERKGYIKEYEENRKHLLESTKYWNVSKYYEHGVNAHLFDDLWNLDYMWYELPQMLGSTFSSPNQAMSTALSAASFGAYASSPWTGGLGAVGGAFLDVAATPFQIAGGHDENYAESGDKRIDQFTELLGGKDSDDYKRIIGEVKRRSKAYWKARGMDEKSIDRNLEGETGDRFALKDLMMGMLDHMVDKNGNPYVKDKYGHALYENPIADPELFRARLYSTQGLLALYDANNMRTMAGTFFEKALTLTPTSWIKKAASAQFDKITNRWIVDTAEDVATDTAGRVTARAAEKTAGKRAVKDATKETYSNGFRKDSFSKTFAKGAARGAAIGEMTGFGFPGQIFGGLTGGAVNTAMRIGLSKLSPAARAAYRGIEEGIIHKYQSIYDKIIPTSEFGRAVSIFGGRVARATAASQLSEAAEEAVQYLNSKEDFASKYGWGGMSLGDMIVNDIYLGARVFDSYMSLFGLSNSELLNDAEYWANAKGGFALGGLHTGIMRMAIEGASAYKERGIHSAILTSGVMNREADAKDRASNVEFARQAMRKRTSETLSVLDWMQKNDSRRENPYFTQEDYDEKISDANAIASMVNNKRIKEGLEAKGITYGTEQYANAIADIYSINKQRQLNIVESREKENNINQLWNSSEYQKEADKIVEHMFASSFEEHMGRGSAIIEAGNKAVNQEISRATAAGESTETSEFKKHLQNVRKEAQEAAARQIDTTYRLHVIGMSHAAHKLQSLIKLKAQHNTISDFFTFLKDKFNLNPKRPDAKLIMQDVDNQIKQAKQDLAEFDEDFDVNMTDGAILDYIKTLPIVNAHSDDIERHEIASAMLQADRAVIDKHAQMFEFGLVRNKDGKLEYNPAAYKAKQTRQKLLADDLRSNKITLDQYTRMILEEQELPEYNSADVENNPYKRRIQAIIDARKDNKALNWMINDIENGDGVVKILEELAEKEYKEDNSDDVKSKAKEESESFSFESSEDETPAVTATVAEPAKPSAKEKYEKRKAGAKKRYQERKKSLKDLRRRAYATFVPIPTPLLDIANALISKAEIATYKIAQFAEELKNVADNNGYNARSFLSGIKSFYIDKLVSILTTNPQLAENFSSTQEIVSFDFGDVVIPQPIVSEGSSSILDIINEDAQKIDNELSTHYDIIVKEGDTVVVYPNKEAIVNARFNVNINRKLTIDRLNTANISDDVFKQALQEEFKNFLTVSIPIDKYVKYRNVEGMIEAIANRRWNLENDQSVVFGKLMRNTVLAIMFNKEDQIDLHIVSRPDVYEAFRLLVINAYQKITSKENGMGLTVIDCNKAIYGTDHSGNKISSEADIIATDGNKLYVIDIRYSFLSLRENWNNKYPRATFTINLHVTYRLKQIEQIINTKFNKGVNGLYCLGVVYNPEDNILTIDIENGSYFIPVRPDTQDDYDNTIESLKDAALDLVDEINNNISEYNIIVDEVKRYVDGYEQISQISVLTFESVLEYINYINTLHARYDHLIDRIDEMRTIINLNQNLYNEVWNSRTDAPLNIWQLPDIYQLYARLKEICADLDLVLDEVPSLKVTTEAERQNVYKLIESIFDAQYILDQIMNNPETAQLDLSAEQLLITVALEKMAQNKDNFGKASMFVRQWWATRLAVGINDNNTTAVKTESDIYFGYINRINSWVDVLRNHVLSEIADYYDLLEWYSAILNNYLTKLLENAQQFSDQYITDFGQKEALSQSIKRGRDLINDFNGVWDTRPEEGFDGPSISPEVDKINRLPVRWMDKWSWSDSIMPAFDLMTNKSYYYLSISPTFLDSKFELYVDNNGELRLAIDGKDKNGYAKHVDIGFINDISKAKNDVERWQYVNNARQKFIRKAIAVINFVNSHPGWEVKFDKTTDKGQILYNQDGTLYPVTKFVFAEDRNKQDLYTIKLSKLNRIGILVTLKGDQIGPDVYSVKGGNNLTEDIGGFDRDYTKQVLNTQSGAIVYFYDTGNGQYIGTAIQATKIGQDAAKLVYLMQKYMDGDRVDQYGFDIMELLRMRLYMADPQRNLTPRNNTNNMVILENGQVIIGDRSYDIISQKNDLIARIADMSNVTRATMMNESMRTSLNSIISRVRTLFGQGGLKKMLLTNGLTFDIEDFIHKNSDPNAQDGSTWLGYMLRNGLLGSSANVLGYKELRISNIRALPKGFSEQKTIEKEIKEATQKPKVVVKADDFFERLKGLKKVIDDSEIDFNRGVEEQEGFVNDVKEYFDNVLGINANVEFSPTDKKFFDTVSKNKRIVGICTDEIIKLSRFVPMSVAWHEAFHKIFELVIPANERDSFYNAYKNSIYGRIKKPSDRDIAEAFADMFMTYMLNKEALNKADTFFKKAKAWIKTFAFNIGMNFKIGKSRSEEMYDLYRKINAGEYKNTEITQEQHDRFKRLFGEGLYYTVTNIDSKTSADFSNIADVGEKDKLVRSLAYYILKSYEIDGLNPRVSRVRITGGTDNMKPTPDRLAEMYDGAVITYLKNQHPVFEEVFEKVEREYKDKDGKTVKRNYYPKFEALSRDIADYISTLFDTMRKPKIEEDDADDSDVLSQNGESIDFKASDTDHWDKAAYEFSKLDGLMDEVKLFFGTIPYGKYAETENESGNKVLSVEIDYGRNLFGTPEFMPIEEVWNLIVKKFHTVSSIEELDKELEKYQTVKEVYAQVYSKFHSLVYGEEGKNNGIYKKNEKGDIIIAQTNFDRESKALQILSAIQSQNLNFLIALSSKQKDEDSEGKSTRIVESSLDRDSRSYPDLWNQYLVSGQIGVFQRERGEGFELDAKGKRKKTRLLFREGMGGKNGADIFSRTAKFFQEARMALQANNIEFDIDGIHYNSNDFSDVNRLKDEIVHKLCTIGIMFERDALDYMLSELYGGVNIDAITRFLIDSPASDDPQVQEDAKLQTLTSFINNLNRYVSDDGIINQELIEKEGYGSIGFVTKLAKYQGLYKRMSTLSMALALNGKKLFTVSQNNTISHIIKQLNTFDLLNDTVDTLSKFGFNVTKNEVGLPIGSIILKAILERKPIKMEGFTYIGFKTDNKGDLGSEYTEEATVEDYIAKMTMLLQGYLIFPTLADKGTWMLINGVPIPGMKFIESKDPDSGESTTVITDAPTVRIIGGKPYLVPSDKVLDQIIEYAKCELLGILQCMEDLGYEKIPGYEKQGRKKLIDDQKIENYHTANGSIEPNGTRFLSLTKLVNYEYNDESHKWELVTYNLNDPREDSVTLLQRAQDVFFAKRDGETIEQMITRQRESMALTLAIQTLHEVNTAVDLGIVKRISYSCKFGDNTITVSDTELSLQNLDSKDLNISLIKALLKHIMDTTKTKGGMLWKNVKDPAKLVFYKKMARSLAIAAILLDATNRHIICSQEVQRCFSGHPAFFKVKYGKTSIIDSAYDIQKRIGGMVSTGEDNILGIPGIKSEYTCAECKDYKIGSKSDIAPRLNLMFSDTQARHVFGLKTGLWEDAYNLSIDELKLKYPQHAALIDKQTQEGARYANAFIGGIDVADGSAYITADMCRDMLRMRGAYTNDVRTAFKTLMSSSKYDWIESADAYETIYKALNIVPTKYTAYGFRRHTSNGKQVSDVAVAYYNKFALFPIFPCMATGSMYGIYDKMTKEEVDMLLMHSAVKVGSQGGVEFNGLEISEPFNKYTQSYAYLRRLLNTDPEEKDTNHIGTLMMKIGLANLVADRNYIDVDGNVVSGKRLLDDFMSSINALADIGAQELKNMFLDKVTKVTRDGHYTEERINYEKVSEYLKELLTARNANKTLIQSILVVTDPITGAKKLATPLAATTDAQWIESIFISTMNKKVVDISVPGNSFIQRSAFAMQGDNEMSTILNNGNRLQMINEEGSMDAVITIDYFEDIIPEGLSFKLAKQWLIDQGIISGVRTGETKWTNAESIMIGYRIPTQAQSSIHALRIVDILPASKNTIIIPEEFTKVTGADFDIDHLYLTSYNFKKDENGKLTRHFDLNTKEYYLNKILSCLLTLLKDTENSINSLYKPIDNDTELVTNVSNLIPEIGSTKDEPYNFGTLHELVIRKNDYITGKNGIAPFALNSTGHMLCRQYKVKFRNSILVENTRLKDFDTILDKDDNFVSAWLSGFINAHVDIVKDPYISRLDVNPFTYNMLNLMIRCGWGNTALWFLANPVIRAMAEANDLADSQYMRRKSNSKSGKTYRQELLYNAVTQYLNDYEVSDEVIGDLLGNTKKGGERARIVNWLEQNQDKLENAAITGEMDHDTALNVFYAWKILEKYSIALSDLVQHTKVDTRKYGKNFIAVAKYYDEYRQLFYPSDPSLSLWDIDSLQALAKGSWISKKTDFVAELPQLILGELTFNANPKFVEAVMKFTKKLEYDGRKMYQDDVVNLSRHLQTAIKSKYFADYARNVLNMSDKDIANLFTGYMSMNRLLVSLKDRISNDPAYARFASNPFLNQIYSMLEDRPVFANGREMADRPGFVTVLDNVDDSKLNSDLLSEGWLALMNDENAKIRKFAKKFIVYAFFSSGEFKGWNKMLKYVPYEWISGKVDTQYQSYSDFIENQLKNVSNDYSDLYDDIVANNFMDYRFAAQMEEVNEDNSRNFLNYDRGVRIGKGVKFDQLNDVAKYISIKKPGMRSGNQDSYDLFKLIGNVKVEKEYHPVYAKIKKRGYHTRGNDIYEYEWDFNYAENERIGSDTFDYDGAIKRVQEYVKSGALEGFSESTIRRLNSIYTKPEESIEVAPKAKTVEPGAHIATRGYKKGDPLKHPNFNYVFTENAQAYIASGHASSSINVGITTKDVKLNVSDVNGTNQAGIRTDNDSNITPNAYGIVVKKYQQDGTGKFVKLEGAFKDTDEDFTLFKTLNEDMFRRLKESSNDIIIFPLQMALGKAALPLRFAEWLREQLAERFNVISEVKKNENSGYEGYGLEIKEVGQNYDWKYEEDSGYSGVLEELGLPEKVRMNGGMTYRPKYDFGRIYLTDNEREYIQENIHATIRGTEYSLEQLDNITKAFDTGKFNINSFGEEPRNDNAKVQIPKEYSDNIDELVDLGLISNLDFDESGEKISNRAIEYVKYLLDNDFYEFVTYELMSIMDDLGITNSEMFKLPFKEFLYKTMSVLQDKGLIDDEDNIEYSYTDKRQLELFSDEDFDSSFSEHCKKH